MPQRTQYIMNPRNPSKALQALGLQTLARYAKGIYYRPTSIICTW